MRGACEDAVASLDASVDAISSDDGGVTVDGTRDDGADGTTNDGGRDDATTNDGSNGDATASDGASDDGPAFDGPAFDGAAHDDGGACVPPYDTVTQCGACGVACVAPDDACLPVDGGYACGQLCTAPASNCGGSCVDESNDPANCGACGKFCPSHLCANGVCQGSTPGDVVVIGHDYATTPPGTSQGRVLANAAFIPSTNPLRVFSYERYVAPGALVNVKAILGQRATQLSRTVAYTVSIADGDVPAQLAPTAYDVMVVYDQSSAPAGALATLGASWAATLTTFTKGGGVVVVLDGAAGTGEMPQLITSAGLLAIASHASVAAGSAVTVTAQSDVVAIGVLNPYGVWDHSASFVPSSPAGVTFVVRNGDGSGDPLVAHRVIQ